jgi:glycerate kinase
MRIVVAPDSFKGCLMAWDVARAISAGAKMAVPVAEITEIPLGDGGEGTAKALAYAVPGARMVSASVRDPLGRPIQAEFAVLDQHTAVVEMAAASGLGLLDPAERDPLRTDTFGTGQLIKAALDAFGREPAGSSERTLILAVGGSATVDGGMGMLAALGARFFDGRGNPLESFGGGRLGDVAAADFAGLDERLRGLRLILASDVTNPLLGPEGAAAVFGPQKGASPAEVALLDRGLANLRAVVKTGAGLDLEGFPGAGAAGGVGAAAVSILGAKFQPGIEIALASSGFSARAMGADLIITGEGHYDVQTLRGKAVAGVATAAAALGVPVVVLVGGIAPEAEWRLPGKVIVLPIADGPLTIQESHRRAAELLTMASRRAVALFAAGYEAAKGGTCK